jgi:SAM-dependent methyltransferase
MPGAPLALETGPVRPLPVIHGRRPAGHEQEHREREVYDSGEAERNAAATAGSHAEPWLNVLDYHEPGSRPALDWLLANPELLARVRGRVLDAGAGTCWLTARVSTLSAVERVYALDLSEHFLATVGVRVMTLLGASLAKVTLVESDFNAIPLESGSIACAFLFGAIHHSLSPIKTLQEIGRCLEPGGVLLILESPAPVALIRSFRVRALAVTAASGTTEMCYTRGEIEYLIAAAHIGSCEVIPLPLSRSWRFRPLARRVLRWLDLERVFKPPNYLFVITRK